VSLAANHELVNILMSTDGYSGIIYNITTKNPNKSIGNSLRAPMMVQTGETGQGVMGKDLGVFNSWRGGCGWPKVILQNSTPEQPITEANR